MSNCTALLSRGDFCDRETLPDAPFPICLKHASQVLGYLNQRVSEEAGPAITAARDFEPEPTSAPLYVPCDGVSVVYYIRVGRFIKIGYSINLHQRVRFYPPDSELLAYERGSRALETQRLRQFRSDRRERLEWFEPSDRLLAHIERTRAALLDVAA